MVEHISIHEKYCIADELKRVDQQLSKHNAALLTSFNERHYLKEGLSEGRAVKSLLTLRNFVKFTGGKLDAITEKQLEAYNLKLAKENKSAHTIADTRKIFKCWLRFLGEKKNWGLIHSPELKAKNPYSNGGALLPSDLPTDVEVLEIFKRANPRLRCMLALCEGAGFRASEAATMRIKDLKWNADGSAHCTARQSKTRLKTILVRADLAHYIKQWVNDLPEQNENRLLFADPKRPDHPLQYHTLAKSLLKIADELKLREKRKIGFHIFRHRHATWCLGHMNLLAAKLRIWGNKTSRMDGVYGAFTNEQIDEEFRKANGDIPLEPQKDLMKESTRLCFKCKKTFPQQVIVCPECSLPLTPEGLKEYQDAKFRQVMLDSISEIIGQEKMNEIFSTIKKTVEAKEIKLT